MGGEGEEIVIIGAGIAGLTTALGLHRLGIKSIVLESSESLRTSGFAFSTWPNAWRALDALGVGDSLRQHHQLLLGIKTFSVDTGLQTAERRFDGQTMYETRCVQRKRLLESLAGELPSGTIRYSSKVVSIQEVEEEISSGRYSNTKLIHLADASVIKAKAVIGADGVNSLVSKWLGFNKPAFTSRSAIRGVVDYDDEHGHGHGHGFDPMFMQYTGNGIRFGVIPCDHTKTVYWFFTFSPSPQEISDLENDGAKMKQYVVSKMSKVPDNIRMVFQKTKVSNIIMSPLRYRHPWELLMSGSISKGNVCVAGDAFHPMTPDIGQGGCSALEDGVVLARCLAQALSGNNGGISREEESRRIESGLNNYARERKWRGFELISTAYVVGCIQQCNGRVLGFLRDKLLAGFLAGKLLKMSSFDCGKL